MSTETALTVAERAAIAIGAPAYEIALVDLVKESASLVQIKDKSGYQQAHSARMRLKGTRVEIQKRAKDAREDAQAFSKAVIAEEKRLVALVCPEEDRLQGLQDVWDAAREAEKQARIQAEEARVAKHRANIDAIRDTALHAATMGTDGIQGLIVEIEQYDVSEAVFEEFATGARVVRDDTLATLRQLHTAALAREAEAARLRAEREELARLRAERDRLAAERVERERVEAAERARVAEAQRIEAERLAEERRKFEEEQRLVREKRAAEERQAAEARAAEEARIAAERAELQRQQDAIAAEQRRQAEAATARTRTIRSEIDALLDCMSDDQLYAVRDFAANVNRRAAA